MKKTYSKPDILFEDFSLSVSIAANCEEETNFAKDQCGYRFAPGMVIFLEGVTGCTTKIEDGSDSYNGICYHNPSDINNLFNS